MQQHVVLAVVIIVSIWAHAWIFLWLRFKVDEGAVVRFLKDHISESDEFQTVLIADKISMKPQRVERVAHRSKEITVTDDLIALSAPLPNRECP